MGNIIRKNKFKIIKNSWRISRSYHLRFIVHFGIVHHVIQKGQHPWGHRSHDSFLLFGLALLTAFSLVCPGR